jgi:hypothetical protein
MSIDLKINYKERVITISTTPETTLKKVKEELQSQTKIPVIQQELSYKNEEKKIVLTDNDQKIKFVKVPENTLALKNLGKQIRWEHVFYI